MQTISIQNIKDRPIIDAIAADDFLLIGDTSDNGIVKRVTIATLAEYFGSSSQPPSPEVALFRINCGGEAFTDSQNRAWIADNYLVSGETYTRFDANAWELADGDLYTTEAYDFVYQIPVTAGNYRVKLHFSEFDSNIEYPRTFGILLNSVAVLSDYSIFNDVGLLRPVVKSFDINVTGIAIAIEGVAGLRSSKVNGIEVIPL